MSPIVGKIKLALATVTFVVTAVHWSSASSFRQTMSWSRPRNDVVFASATRHDVVVNKLQLEQANCGRPNAGSPLLGSNRMPRIVGGIDTRPGEFPWTASIRLDGRPICGGSLISRDWILTAAHCLVGYNPRNLSAVLGAHRVRDLENEHTALATNISLFIVHREYSYPRPFSNDIALVKLAVSAKYTDFILPICLPESGTTSAGVTFNGTASGENQADVDGVVVTNKMSDTEILRAFYDLERNYLMSPVAPSSSVVESPQSASQATIDPIGNRNTNNNKQAQNQMNNRQDDDDQVLSDSIHPFNINGMFMDKIKSYASMKELDEPFGHDSSTNNNNSNNEENEIDDQPDETPQITSTTQAPSEDDETANMVLQDDSYVGLVATVVGWGWVRDLDPSTDGNGSGKGQWSSVLQKVKLPVLDNDKCEQWFQLQGKKITLLPSQFCAGFRIGGKDACRGDSGGPMISEISARIERYYLLGVVSAGIGCARPGLPGLYTRVSSFLPWIQSHVHRY